jgi:hypothetical protein
MMQDKTLPTYFISLASRKCASDRQFESHMLELCLMFVSILLIREMNLAAMRMHGSQHNTAERESAFIAL